MAPPGVNTVKELLKKELPIDLKVGAVLDFHMQD